MRKCDIFFKKSVTNSLQELGYESNLNVHQQMNG